MHNNQLSKEEYPVCMNQETSNFTNIHPCEAAVALAFKKIPAEVERIFGVEADIS